MHYSNTCTLYQYMYSIAIHVLIATHVLDSNNTDLKDQN